MSRGRHSLSASELGRLRLPDGYTLTHANNGHLKVIRPDGQPLRFGNGMQVRVAATPGDPRTRDNEASKIRKAIDHADM